MSQTTLASKFCLEVERQLPFIANPGQKEAIAKLAGFIGAKEQRPVFILKGYAGTGKTNLLSATTRALPSVRWRSVLLAPTGRAAKVFSAYAGRPAFTIHKKIYHKNAESGGSVSFSLSENLHRNTLFIVDESSMIGAGSASPGMYNNLLEDLFEYVYSGDNCKLVLVGDAAQLPPVGSDISPALDAAYLSRAFHLDIHQFELTEVARQRSESGILHNATALRQKLASGRFGLPLLNVCPDVISLTGTELEDALQNSIREFGEDNVIIITKSNKRAGLYNKSYRNLIRLYEEDLCTGDKLMVVKNNYFWLPESNGEAGFIANGDMAEITRINRREELYGFGFCDCSLRFSDYPGLPEIEVKIITNALFTDHPALTDDEQKSLYEQVMLDVADVPARSARLAYVRKSPHYNALQVKFSYAVTCHKSQGGQWPVVFIDQPYLREGRVDAEFIRWLYTAITRAREKIYLVNFEAAMFI